MIEELLLRVQKPARYIGGEYNSVYKDKDSVKIRFAFCFPDVYDIGMSNLALKILYGILNLREDTYCERAFAPFPDMEDLMRKEGVELFSLETRDSLRNFDIIGFTLQYEMSYSNIINMLDLAGIPFFSKDRGDDMPFVCAGGPGAFNPEPLADFIDFFMIGEGEEVINEVMDVYSLWKDKKASREDFLRMICVIPGVYVPSFYDVSYKSDGTVKEIKPKFPFVPKKIKKRIIENFDEVYFPTNVIVPFIQTVHDRIVLEIYRGCPGGCRFCQAGMTSRPLRERSPEKLIEIAEESLKNTGYEEISLSSLSSGDYSNLLPLCKGLLTLTENRHVNLSLPSLRIDSIGMEILSKTYKERKSSLTFAPEAGTQRLRTVINKNVTDDDLKNSSQLAFEKGFSSLKLYFMIGLPTERDEDVLGICSTAEMVAKVYFGLPKEKRRKPLRISLSTSTFVPKPHTPFQWSAQQSIDETLRKQDIIKRALSSSKYVKYSWHDAWVSFLEGVFSRGDRRLSKVFVKAHELGCRFDGWDEFFSFEKWDEAFKACNIDPLFYNYRARDLDEVLPWAHIDIGVLPEFLKLEYEKSVNEISTKKCSDKCSACGWHFNKGGACFGG